MNNSSSSTFNRPVKVTRFFTLYNYMDLSFFSEITFGKINCLGFFRSSDLQGLWEHVGSAWCVFLHSESMEFFYQRCERTLILEVFLWSRFIFFHFWYISLHSGCSWKQAMLTRGHTWSQVTMALEQFTTGDILHLLSQLLYRHWSFHVLMYT